VYDGRFMFGYIGRTRPSFVAYVFANQEQHENHAYERHQSRHDDDRVEGVCGQRLLCIGEVTD